MHELLRVTIIGLIAGVLGTGAGGVLAFFLKHPKGRLLSGIIGFSAGLMIAVVTFELVAEALEYGTLALTMGGLGAGALVTAQLDLMISHLSYRKTLPGQGYRKTGLLLGLGIALHNFPEGLAIGAGFAAKEALGLSLVSTIAFHDIPEGMAMVTPMRAGGISKKKAFLSTIFAGLPTGLGALIGELLGNVNPRLIALCLAFAGGTMLYITFGELLPQGKEITGGPTAAIFGILGFIMGMYLIKTL